MKTNTAFVVSALVLLTIVPTVALALNISKAHHNGTVSKIVWERTGGFIGLNEKLTILANGSMSYISNYFGSVGLNISKTELEDLLDKVGFFKEDRSYVAKMNAADYFAYKITIETTSGTKTIKWVDAWASEKALPPELEELQDCILAIIEGIHQEIQ